jgi:hypothetical protein
MWFILRKYNRGADPRASQEMQGACTLRLREAQSGQVPCSGARRQNKVLDEVSAAILGGVAAENASLHLTAVGTKKLAKSCKIPIIYLLA